MNSSSAAIRTSSVQSEVRVVLAPRTPLCRETLLEASDEDVEAELELFVSVARGERRASTAVLDQRAPCISGTVRYASCPELSWLGYVAASFGFAGKQAASRCL